MDPGTRFGKPCLTGTRIDVATVVRALAAGESFEAIEQDYNLTHEQVLAALRYAAHVASPASGGQGCLVRILLDENFRCRSGLLLIRYLMSSNASTWFPARGTCHPAASHRA